MIRQREQIWGTTETIVTGPALGPLVYHTPRMVQLKFPEPRIVALVLTMTCPQGNPAWRVAFGCYGGNTVWHFLDGIHVVACDDLYIAALSFAPMTSGTMARSFAAPCEGQIPTWAGALVK